MIRKSELLRMAIFGRAVVRCILTDEQLDVRPSYDGEMKKIMGDGVSVREASAKIFSPLNKEADSKKIAEVFNGGAAQEDRWITEMAAAEDGALVCTGGTPEKALPPMGKAQITIQDLQDKYDEVVNAVGLPDQLPIYGTGKAQDLVRFDNLRDISGNSISLRPPLVYKARSEGITDFTVGVGDTCLVRRNHLEGVDAVEGAAEAGQDGRGSGRGVEAATGGSDGAEGGTVGVGSAEVGDGNGSGEGTSQKYGDNSCVSTFDTDGVERRGSKTGHASSSESGRSSVRKQ